MDREILLPIARIVGVHGIKGNLKFLSYSGNLSVFKPDRMLFTRNPSGKTDAHVVEWAVSYKRGGLLSFKGVTQPDEAEELVGSELLIEKKDLPELEEGAFYWFDLIGLSVRTADNRMIGKIESIIETGSNDVYVVQNDDNEETLIPALTSVIVEIDLKNHVMRVNLPEGL